MSVFIFNIINGNGEEIYSEAFCNNALKVDGKDEIGLLHVDLLSTRDTAGFLPLYFKNYSQFPSSSKSYTLFFFYSHLWKIILAYHILVFHNQS